MILLWRALLLGVALFLAWRIVAAGLGGYYADRMTAGDQDAVGQVLTWQPEHPEGLLALALRQSSEDKEAAQALLTRSYRANPAGPRPLIVLATQSMADGDIGQADSLIEIATKLAPVNPRIQKQVAAYWAGRGDLERSLSHLSTVMEADGSERRALFSILLRIVEDPETRGLLAPYALSPPAWWDGFFRFAVRRASTLEPARYLYNLRRKAGAEALSDSERATYVWRLQKDGAISEAYLVWLNGLDAGQRQYLGLLYNGGFEFEPSNQGFDWRIGKNDRVDIHARPTFGAIGNHAMNLNFRALKQRFGHLAQALFLDAGTYRLAGKTRSGAGFTTKGGLKWQARCLLPNTQRLGESERLLGSTEWTEFDFEFEVPPSCRYQELRLMSAGTRSFELKISGDIWFDDLRISRALKP